MIYRTNKDPINEEDRRKEWRTVKYNAKVNWHDLYMKNKISNNIKRKINKSEKLLAVKLKSIEEKKKFV